VKKLDELLVMELRTGRVQARLAKRFLITVVRDGEVWVQTSRGYDIYTLPRLKKRGALVLPTPSGKQELSPHDAFSTNRVYRGASAKPTGWTTRPSRVFVQAVDLDSGQEVFLSRLPVPGNIDSIEAFSGVVAVTVRWGNRFRLVILDGESGQVLHADDRDGGSPEWLSWRSTGLFGARDAPWSTWDSSKRRLQRCAGLPVGATLCAAGRQLYAHKNGRLVHLESDGAGFKAARREAKLDDPSGLFAFGSRVGCFVASPDDEGAQLIQWLRPGSLAVAGESSPIRINARAVTAGPEHIIVMDFNRGLVCIRVD
jgi:hypothetical protein